MLDRTQQTPYRIAQDRRVDFVVIAESGAWFSYYYWLDDDRAPDFARTVYIHRKHGYDPAELLIDPAIRLPALEVGWKLAKKALGFRYLMDVIPLDAALVRGSHGRPSEGSDDGPVLITQQPDLLSSDRLRSVDVAATILAHLSR